MPMRPITRTVRTIKEVIPNKPLKDNRQVDIDKLLSLMPVPNQNEPMKKYRHSLPINLINRIEKFRVRQKEHTEITVYRRDTIRFALELLLALEPAIF